MGKFTNFLKPVKHRLGLDIEMDKYAYDMDEQFGFMSKAKIPDQWVQTTCGFCSVGCGMYIGVKGNEAVSVRGNPSHPVNEGRLCPKGLAEHYAISAPNRAKWPLLKVKKSDKKISGFWSAWNADCDRHCPWCLSFSSGSSTACV